jgi:hypothetical protein
MRFGKSEDERAAAREQRLRGREQTGEPSRGRRAQMEIRRAEQRQRREALWREQAARRAATTVLAYLGVAVRGGEVFTCTLEVVTGRSEGLRLGDLAEAHADVTRGKGGFPRSGIVRAGDAASAMSVPGAVGLLAGASRKGFLGTAFVIFADGTLHEKPIADQASLLKAQAEAVRFNAIAVVAAPRSEPVPHDGVCPDCGTEILQRFGRAWDDDGGEHDCR